MDSERIKAMRQQLHASLDAVEQLIQDDYQALRRALSVTGTLFLQTAEAIGEASLQKLHDELRKQTAEENVLKLPEDLVSPRAEMESVINDHRSSSNVHAEKRTTVDSDGIKAMRQQLHAGLGALEQLNQDDYQAVFRGLSDTGTLFLQIAAAIMEAATEKMDDATRKMVAMQKVLKLRDELDARRSEMSSANKDHRKK